MKSINIFSMAALVLFLQACKVSADVATPNPELPNTYRTVSAADTANIASVQWKEFFTNSDLRNLIDSTIAHNYDLQIALKNIEAAQLIVKQSKLGYLPEARLQAGASISRPSDNSLNGISLSQFLGQSYVEDYTLSVGVTWEADIWGKIRNQKERALASYLQSQEARKAIQTNLVSYVANGYYNLLMLDAQLSIARKNVLLADSTLAIIQLQYNAGQVTNLGVQQATAQRLVAIQLIPQLEQEIAIQENALSVLSGTNPKNIQRNGQINESIHDGSLSAGVPSTLLQNRPDIRSKELQLTIANANTGIAKANMYPTLSITATGGINAFKASNWFSVPASLFAIGSGGITQPLFQRKQLKTQYELSRIEREKAVLGFRQSVLTAVGEVSDALVKVNKLAEQQAIAAARVQTLQQAIGNANLLFRNGMATYLEVITAQSNVLEGELQLAVIQKQQSAAAIELYRSLGGGWR